MKKQQHYYLKDNRIWMANEKMPELKLNNYRSHYLECLESWKQSLQPCEISESELNKIYTHLSITITDVCLRDYIKNPIEVTDIISDSNGVITFKENKNRKTVLKELEYLSNTDLAFFLHWFEEFRSVEDLNNFSIDDIVNQYRRDYPINKTKQVDGEIESQDVIWSDITDIATSRLPYGVIMDKLRSQFTVTRIATNNSNV